MNARILFISDLHLEADRPDITRSLLHFLQKNQENCQALYILGDLFEVWIGDDEESALADCVAAALQKFAACGSAVFIMHGNRDFLLGSDFAGRCGATLIADPYTLRTANGDILLLHGDSLCTDDIDYQNFRRLVRDPSWQQEFLAKPLTERRDFARQARQQSQAATANKAMDIMDVNQSAVQELIHTSGQHCLLHGHTHRPAVHHLPAATGKPQTAAATRTVLGAWDEQAWYGEFTEHAQQRKVGGEGNVDLIALHSFALLVDSDSD